mmetsp:Transcript_112453/g.223460  ORF Transcript_112453/g.223460 Transcript_112453/m.223460 type:complete len:216 (+) Transcript_112453:82-729(+)|eukprot:CAMPEP_0172768670 /NCGR_PEP_ID=MMETSP1074-20121228/185240_1 /TAXON_ID=2916 /ORGANISM="Ceratium fusus, Strain PA161109" /LENGTH=215 /DNA_ID=CAMNT_0013604113 /DNA_START=9 /DNA_END=656 /DNA_ORIENTATION=-
MAAFEDFNMPASLAAVRNAGALSLDLPKPEWLGREALPETSPMAMSPWATSTEACNSPWSPVTPAVSAKAVGTQMNNTAVVPAGSPFFPSPTTPQGRPQPNYAASVVHHSPAMSPTSEIRSNALSFGIPLQTDMGKVGAPLPIRTMSGILVAPSPTTRGSAPPPVAPMVRHQDASQAAVAPAIAAGGVQPARKQFIRSMATPFMAVQTRRAAGGA